MKETCEAKGQSGHWSSLGTDNYTREQLLAEKAVSLIKVDKRSKRAQNAARTVNQSAFGRQFDTVLRY